MAPADLLPEAELVLPEEQMMPMWQPAPCVPPKWVPPCEPRPVGFLRGGGPVLVFDVSGTMHPARQGQFVRMRQCVAELLHPQGGHCRVTGCGYVCAFLLPAVGGELANTPADQLSYCLLNAGSVRSPEGVAQRHLLAITAALVCHSMQASQHCCKPALPDDSACHHARCRRAGHRRHSL